MGSDMAMEAANFVPRQSYAVWEGDELVVYKDTPITGFYAAWRGKPDLDDDTVRSLLLTMVRRVPQKPRSIESRLREILENYSALEISSNEAIEEIKDVLSGE